LRIEVSQDDIDRGHRCDSAFCPVARAIRRHTGRVVLVTDVRFERPDGGRLVPPHDVYLFVIAYDAGRPVAPFGFELPDEFLGG